jgi:transcriptional regulator with XRE-family HTH domain
MHRTYMLAGLERVGWPSSPVRSAEGQSMTRDRASRYCSCGTRLARDNPGSMCATCQDRMRDLVMHPPEVPAEFWTTDQIRDALDSWHMGRVISAYRSHPFHGRVLRQEIVAGWMGITQAQLSRIENGSAVQDLQKLRHWASLLGIPGELLWFKLSRRQGEDAADSVGVAPDTSVACLGRVEIDDMNRRELLRLIGVAGASLATPLPSLAGLDEACATEGLLAASMEQHGVLNAQLWQLYDTAQVKMSVLPLVRNQLDALTSKVQQARTLAARRQLSELLADLLQLAGEISFDTNHYTEAAHCYTLAATASKEAGNRDMWACSLIRHSFIPLYDRQFGTALPMLQAATQLTRGGDSQLPTRQWASTVTAQAHAGLGDLASCQKALDDAETVHDLPAPTHTTGWLRFTGSRLSEERGTCLVELHQYEQAEASLTDALQRGPSGRRTGSINTDLAVVGARLRDTDRVTTYAEQALAAARRTKSGYVVKKLAALKPHLGPLLGNRAVRQLNDDITHLSTPPRSRNGAGR